MISSYEHIISCEIQKVRHGEYNFIYILMKLDYVHIKINIRYAWFYIKMYKPHSRLV